MPLNTSLHLLDFLGSAHVRQSITCVDYLSFELPLYLFSGIFRLQIGASQLVRVRKTVAPFVYRFARRLLAKENMNSQGRVLPLVLLVALTIQGLSAGELNGILFPNVSI